MCHSFDNIRPGIFTYEGKTIYYDAISYTRKMSFLLFTQVKMHLFEADSFWIAFSLGDQKI